jgi:glucose dehydrogenase
MSNGTDYDVVLVGAGAVGSLMAYKLANASTKVRVLILEAGPEYDSIENRVNAYYSAPAKTPDAPWPDAPQARRPSVLDVADKQDWQDEKYYLRQKGPLPFSSTYERYPGGTANHWLGTALRLLPEDFELASRYKVEGAKDWPLKYDDLEKYYTEAEGEIGVSGSDQQWADYYGKGLTFPMPQIPQSYLDQQYVKNVGGKQINGLTVKVLSTPQARNSQWYQGRPPCVGNTSCVPICPVRAKYDPSHHLKSALGQTQLPTYPLKVPGGKYPAPAPYPAVIQYKAVAYKVDVDATSGAISGIAYKTWDGQEKRVTARRYVLCAHAVENAKLLLNSPWTTPKGKQATVANSSGQVGLNLMDHPILLLWGLTKDPVYPFRGPLSTSGISNYRFGPARKDRAAYIIEIGNEGWNWPTGAPFSTVHDMTKTAGPGEWFGVKLREAVHQHCIRQVRLAAEFESLPSEKSRVVLSRTDVDALGIPRPEIHYELSEYTQRGFDDALITLRGILDALGTTEVHSTVDPNSPGVFTTKKGNTFQFRGAGHIMGTHRMGKDPLDSVVDADCRSHDHPNLFLVGGGSFPSTGTANPTLTILALALRASEQILTDLKTERAP